jgi:hypothetical protein
MSKPLPVQTLSRSTRRNMASSPYPTTPTTTGNIGTKYHANALFRSNERFKPFKDLMTSSRDVLSFEYDRSLPTLGYLTPVP